MNIRTHLMSFVISALLPCVTTAQDFYTYFADSTLRLDYMFAGKRGQVQIYPEELNLLSGWAGRRARLDSLPLQGNGQIKVWDKASDRLIYTTSFSSLFQEWLMTDEATQTPRTFENVFLIPLPRREAIVEIRLQGSDGQDIAQLRHTIAPKDILIHRRTEHKPARHEYLHRSRSPNRAIDIAILAEGYTERELEQFARDARRATDALFRHKVFGEYKDRFNVVAVYTPSAESGVSVPREGKWLDTPFGAHFDTFYSDRYLTSRRVKAIHNALIGIPYEHIIVLANSGVYGGGGIYNAFTLTSVHHPLYEPVVVHEFGHSFAGLADEYFYDEDTMTDTYSREREPWEQNVTNLVDFGKGKKWHDLCQNLTPHPHPKNANEAKVVCGLYEGAAYSKRGFYRCSYDCRMRTNTFPDFCPACERAIGELILFYTK